MRLDALLHSEGYFPSRTKASEAVLEGKVLYKNQEIVLWRQEYG